VHRRAARDNTRQSEDWGAWTGVRSAMDASASASPVALLSYVIGERSSAERRRPSRSQIYKIPGFAAIVVHMDAWWFIRIETALRHQRA